MSKEIKKTHQNGYKLGIIGQIQGKCCKGYCLDCEFIRRNVKGLNITRKNKK